MGLVKVKQTKKRLDFMITVSLIFVILALITSITVYFKENIRTNTDFYFFFILALYFSIMLGYTISKLVKE